MGDASKLAIEAGLMGAELNRENVCLDKKNKALVRALQDIIDSHIGDQPALSDLSEIEWAQKHVSLLRGIAREALQEHQS